MMNKYLTFCNIDFELSFEDFNQAVRMLFDDYQVNSVSGPCFRTEEVDEVKGSLKDGWSLELKKSNTVPKGLVRIAILNLHEGIKVNGDEEHGSVTLAAEYVASGFWAITSMFAGSAANSAPLDLFCESGDSKILIAVETGEGLRAGSKIFVPDVTLTDKKVEISEDSLQEIVAYILGCRELTNEIKLIDIETGEDDDIIPPFQSSQGFPRTPRNEDLPSLYPACLQALRDANKARHILRCRMDKKKRAILEIQDSIQSLERDLLLEAEVRQSLHLMNEKLLGALREMEGIVDDFDRVVEDGHRTQRSRLVPLIERLKALFAAWRELRLRWSVTVLDNAEKGHKGQNDG